MRRPLIGDLLTRVLRNGWTSFTSPHIGSSTNVQQPLSSLGFWINSLMDGHLSLLFCDRASSLYLLALTPSPFSTSYHILSTINKPNDFKSRTNTTSFLQNIDQKWKGYWYVCTKRVPDFSFSLHFSTENLFYSTMLSSVSTTKRFITTTILISRFLQSICYVTYVLLS